MSTAIFQPKFLSLFRPGGYSREQFQKDLLSGFIVGVVALPLAIAFGIASGVSPEKGLVTAIVAGFLISILGGSQVQIGGPTGAFIVIVYGIVERYGIEGLTIATFMAGIMIALLGIVRLGSVIKFIPHSLVVGFTSGIALIIFSSQIRDMFGLQTGQVPSGFVEKWRVYFQHLETINPYAAGIAIVSALFCFFFHRVTTKIPGPLVAIVLSTAAVMYFKLPVETIQSKFGDIPTALPPPELPHLNWGVIRSMIKPAFTIALLGAIESLLTAVVADGMIGGNHRSNTELVAQGIANMASAVFGGIPATGAIARTVTNIKNGGRTPVSGMVHAFVLLLIMFFLGKWAGLIPMASLAGILLVVAYNMSEWRSFLSVLRGPRGDILILLTTFFLTVLFDLTIAIEAGIVLSAFVFMRNMAKYSSVQAITDSLEAEENPDDPLSNARIRKIKGVEVYEINGPLFFGNVHAFTEILRDIQTKPKIVILRMRSVPLIDETGIHYLRSAIRDLQSRRIKVILSGVQPKIYEELDKSRIVFLVGKKNIYPNILEALNRAEAVLADVTPGNT